MTPHRRFLSVLVLVSLSACRSAVVERAPEAPSLPTTGFVSLGPSDAPRRAAEPAVAGAPLACDGPLLAVSAQPDDADFVSVRAQGYRTVVNFRHPEEKEYVDEKATVEKLGMRYVAIPVKGKDVQLSDADLLAPVLADPAAGPVLMHCRSGARATAVWTLWLARHGGLSADEAIRYGERAGLAGESKAAVEKLLR
jgi:uncharacterized protein (TIGR01244 family)